LFFFFNKSKFNDQWAKRPAGDADMIILCFIAVGLGLAFYGGAGEKYPYLHYMLAGTIALILLRATYLIKKALLYHPRAKRYRTEDGLLYGRPCSELPGFSAVEMEAFAPGAAKGILAENMVLYDSNGKAIDRSNQVFNSGEPFSWSTTKEQKRLDTEKGPVTGKLVSMQDENETFSFLFHRPVLKFLGTTRKDEVYFFNADGTVFRETWATE